MPCMDFQKPKCKYSNCDKSTQRYSTLQSSMFSKGNNKTFLSAVMYTNDIKVCVRRLQVS